MSAMVEYESYMRSGAWKAKRAQYRARRPWRCGGCGFKRGLHLHHLTYDNLGDEPLDDLVPLCPDCHEQVHQWAAHGGSIRSATKAIIAAGSTARGRSQRVRTIKAARVAKASRRKKRAAAHRDPRWLADRLGLPPGETKVRYK